MYKRGIVLDRAEISTTHPSSLKALYLKQLIKKIKGTFFLNTHTNLGRTEM